MKARKKRWSDYFWIVSAVYFTLGFFNIVFAWLGVICFAIPLLMAIFGGGKGYCNNYCGRGQLFLQIGNTLGWSRKKTAPRWLSSKWFRNDLYYRTGGKGYAWSVGKRSSAMDIQCALALGLSCRCGTLEGAVCLRSLRNHAHLADSGSHFDDNL